MSGIGIGLGVWLQREAPGFFGPPPENDTRVTEEGDTRLTEEGDDRVTES